MNIISHNWTDPDFPLIPGIPSPDVPIVNYEGQLYKTVLIDSQCWFKENLNVGTMIVGTREMEDNGMIEKYCYDDLPDNCDIFGGFYQWAEIMNYTNQPGIQGICPPTGGWHIPTEGEMNIAI